MPAPPLISYIPYLLQIKRLGIYLLATSVKGVFKQDGRLFETGVYCYVCSSNFCTAAVTMLFLDVATTALSLNRRSGVSPSVSVSLSLPS